MKIRLVSILGALFASLVIGQSGFGQTDDGSVLPFPPTPSGSTAARSMQDSKYNPLPQPNVCPVTPPTFLSSWSMTLDRHFRIPTAATFTLQICLGLQTLAFRSIVSTRLRCVRRRGPHCWPDVITIELRRASTHHAAMIGTAIRNVACDQRLGRSRAR